MSSILLQATPEAALGASKSAPKNAIASIEAVRSPNNPLITFASSKSLGDNINGPSVIRMPEWVADPLGKYYMYFGHHSGKDIRLAYADDPAGPWKIHEPGALNIGKVKALNGHIASPDVHIDNEKKEIVMYLHGRASGIKEQQTLLARSRDGLRFAPETQLLGTSYFRVFDWKGSRYAIDGGGRLNRAPKPDAGGDGRWESRAERLFAATSANDEFGKRDDIRIRHSALLLEGDTLIVFYTLKSEAPERILVSTIRLTDDWNKWQPSEPLEVLRPKESYEGVEYKNKPSEAGPSIKVQQLRDPCIFVEEGKTYLYYSVAGEMGIAMAEIKVRIGPGGK